MRHGRILKMSKKQYLVKGEERHEVEVVDGRYNFKALGHMITPLIATHLGYTLEEVDERIECWANIYADSDNSFHLSREIADHMRGGDRLRLAYLTELREGEIIIDREKLWQSRGMEFKQACKHLGLEESES
jgi:hypothetical protein